MSVPREVSTFELSKAGSVDANPSTLLQKARAFQTQAPDGTTLSLLRDEGSKSLEWCLTTVVTIYLAWVLIATLMPG